MLLHPAFQVLGDTTCNPVCSVHVAFQCCAGARPWPCRLRVDCPNLEGRSFGGLPVIVVSVSVRTGGCVPNHSTGWTSQPVALVMSVRLRLQRTHMWMPHTSTYMQYLYATNACRCILCVCDPVSQIVSSSLCNTAMSRSALRHNVNSFYCFGCRCLSVDSTLWAHPQCRREGPAGCVNPRAGCGHEPFSRDTSKRLQCDS